MVETAVIQAKLEILLARFPEVSEAYLYAPKTGKQSAVLGVLCKKMNSDRRHSFFEDVAMISNQYFGTTDAIDVYDDLTSEKTNSWDLFSGLSPFYYL